MSRRLGILLCAVILGGCGSAASPTVLPTDAPTPSLAATATITTTPAPTPSPTPDPGAVAVQAFIAKLAATPPTATLQTVQASISAAYNAGTLAASTPAQQNVAAMLAECAPPTAAVLLVAFHPADTANVVGQGDIAMCETTLEALIHAIALNPAGAFGAAALQLWGYTIGLYGVTERQGLVDQLDRAFAAELGIVPTTISGRVSDASGKPLAGLSVSVEGSGGGMMPATVTRTDGTYSVTGVWPGTYRITIGGSDGLPSLLVGPSGWVLDSSSYAGVRVDSAPVMLDFAFPAVVSVSGTVQDQSGAAFPDVRVTAFADNSDARSTATTDASGAFSLGLVAGSWSLLFEVGTADAQGFLVTSKGIVSNLCTNPDACPTPVSFKVGSNPISGKTYKLPISK